MRQALLQLSSARLTTVPEYTIDVCTPMVYHITAHTQVRLLLMYLKGVKDDLTAAEKKTLRKLNQDW